MCSKYSVKTSQALSYFLIFISHRQHSLLEPSGLFHFLPGYSCCPEIILYHLGLRLRFCGAYPQKLCEKGYMGDKFWDLTYMNILLCPWLVGWLCAGNSILDFEGIVPFSPRFHCCDWNTQSYFNSWSVLGWLVVFYFLTWNLF